LFSLLKNLYKLNVFTKRIMPEIKRQTAYKCTINQILTGEYVQKTGWDPNYIELGQLQISRVNIIAAVVSKEDNTIFVDDSTGKISIMLFNETADATKINVGDVIIIIGKPREYNKQRYIVSEILRKIENKKWIEYRQKELSLQKHTPIQKNEEPTKESNIPDVHEEEQTNNYAYQLIALIKKLDAGSGADITDVIGQSKISGAEKYITTLLNEGEIFEIRSGKLKVLE